MDYSLISTEALVGAATLVGALVAIVAGAIFLLVQSTGERFSPRLAIAVLRTRHLGIPAALLLLTFVWLTSAAIFGWTFTWHLPEQTVGLRADWGTWLFVTTAFGLSGLLLWRTFNRFRTDALIASLVEPLHALDSERWAETMVLARDIGAAAINHADFETWSSLVHHLREGIAATTGLWSDQSIHPRNLEMESDTRRFFSSMYEVISIRGLLSAATELTDALSHLVRFSANNDLEATDPLVEEATRTATWCLAKGRFHEFHVLVKAISVVPGLQPASSRTAFDALKQLGDLVTREARRPTYFVSLIHEVDPWDEYLQIIDELREAADKTGDYATMSEVQLVLEVIAARSWETRSCKDIRNVAHAMSTVSRSTAKGSGFGYLILMAGEVVESSMQRLLAKGCVDEAAQTLEMLIEVAANGMREGLTSQVGSFPGTELIRNASSWDRPSLEKSLTELFVSQHFQYIPRRARYKLIRRLQDDLNDNLGFRKRLDLPE